ncbi:laccase-2-like [Anneissia japonica]|uniref:laccase-2-like n=1 Tax=Anneissia japonica TaxID=1529436 RepID=UPI0014257ADD|nr:laccase-2-like [Anneissia japonica]
MVKFWTCTLLLIFVKHGLISALQCKIKEKPQPANDDSGCLRTCEYPAQPRICEYEFTVAWTNSMSAHCGNCPFVREDCSLENCISVDGSSRNVLAANGSFPGPSIQVCENDIIRVKVNNNAQNFAGLSIHWHGIHQIDTNWMDGVPRLTQCPIARGSSFVYEFKADPAGTHWWHVHTGFSRADGLLGSLIVRKPKILEQNSNQYDFDLPEHTIMLSDWSNIGGLDTSLKTAVPAKFTRTPTLTILVNGKGSTHEFIDDNGQTFKTPGTIFEVQEGVRYRFRIIGGFVAACTTSFYITGHRLIVINVDGYEVAPENVGSLRIGPGERYDIVLHADQAPSTYCGYMVGIANASCANTYSFLLKYKNSQFSPVCNSSHSFVNEEYGTPQHQDARRMLSLNLAESLEPIDPEWYNVDETFYISLRSFDMFTTGPYAGQFFGRPAMNNAVFLSPHMPFVTNPPGPSDTCDTTRNKTMYDTCVEDHCMCTNVLKIQLGKVVDLVMLNLNGDIIPHALHMHGSSFRVLGVASFRNTWMNLQKVIELDEQGGLLRRPVDKAVLKDTLNVPENGYAILRIKADNPGYWLFHCHILNHAEVGQCKLLF